MNDTDEKIARMVAERHRRMTVGERVAVAAEMFETARAIVEASLPEGLSRRERRLAWARRFYGGELPEAALEAYAAYGEVKAGA